MVSSIDAGATLYIKYMYGSVMFLPPGGKGFDRT